MLALTLNCNCIIDLGAAHCNCVLLVSFISNYDSNTTASLDASEGNTQTFETLEICYSKIEMLYIPRDENNRELTPIRTGYDLKKASKI